ncbi:hypothetical protein B0A49_07101 [Cryomyces minteri]|uniref:Prenylcysteine lyase domain-containing protein n=1 Tax=Cryomyces minteri TaxID=331657 RepID=A0A4U0WQV9_9PEZI|nr:hypothetical protein B0A49_07101 [Cryomyces minteri]
MKLHGYLVCLAVLLTHSLAVDSGHPQEELGSSSSSVKQVAIIGAGSAGSSAAYYLDQYATQCGRKANITVFERSSYVGGRSTTVNVYDDSDQPVELGASIFVQVNRNLVNAAKVFNLTTSGMRDAAPYTDGPKLGVWNGEEFVITQTASSNWWNTAKLLWRYGWAPVRTMNLVKSTTAKFFKMYDAPVFPWKSLSQTAYDLGLTAVTAATGEQYLQENGIGRLFADEIIQASTRVNYAQNLGLIHGLEPIVCMATDVAMAVEGGNWQIFDGMLTAASAHVRLNTAVTQIERQPDASYIVRSKPADSATSLDAQEDSQHFDAVILAAPYQFSDISLSPPPLHTPGPIPYVSLHVTLFASPHLLSSAAFNLAPGTSAPQVILTTLPPSEHPGADPAGVGSAGFFSLSTLRAVQNRRFDPPRAELLYKVFSPAPVNSSFLAHVLGLPTPATSDAEIAAEEVSWIHRKVWHSYPYEFPRVTFEEIRLDEALWYTSGIESFISTMETSSLMGMNVARLVADTWEEEGREREREGEAEGGWAEPWRGGGGAQQRVMKAKL